MFLSLRDVPLLARCSSSCTLCKHCWQHLYNRPDTDRRYEPYNYSHVIALALLALCALRTQNIREERCEVGMLVEGMVCI